MKSQISKSRKVTPIKMHNKLLIQYLDEQDYTCYCGQTKFNKEQRLPPSKYYIRRHLLSHLKLEKPHFWLKKQDGEYKCNVCNQGFKSRAELKLHYYNPHIRKFQVHKLQILIDHMVDVQCFFQKQSRHNNKMLRIIYRFFEQRYGTYIVAKAQGVKLSKYNVQVQLDEFRVEMWKQEHHILKPKRPIPQVIDVTSDQE